MKFGIDIGGTTVKIGLVDQNTILDKFEIPTHKETLFEDICIAIKEYMDKKRYIEIEGLGFGIPGNVVQNYAKCWDNQCEFRRRDSYLYS